MADDDWDSDAPDAGGGPSKDILRKARAVNPALAAQGTTTELLLKVQGKPAAPQQQSLRPQAASDTPDLLSVYLELKKKHEAQLKALEAQITQLMRDKDGLPAKTLDLFVTAVLAADPNMTSPQTKELLRAEARFLDAIGFSIRKVVEKRLKKK